MTPLLELLGLLLFVFGAALVYLPAGLMLAGLVLVVVANLARPRPQPAADEQEELV